LEKRNNTESLNKDLSGLFGIPILLEIAIRSYPEIAHRVLAAYLSLLYNGIQNFIKRAQKYSQIQ